MSRNISARATRSINANATDEVWIPLVTLSNDEWEESVYIARNEVEIVHLGRAFLPFPFDIDLPDQGEDNQGVLEWVADVADQSILAVLLSTESPVQANVKWVLASQPDIVEIEFPALELRGFNYDESQMTGSLSIEPILDQPFGYFAMTPETAPGIF
jgi:hypothetical protein